MPYQNMSGRGRTEAVKVVEKVAASFEILLSIFLIEPWIWK